MNAHENSRRERRLRVRQFSVGSGAANLDHAVFYLLLLDPFLFLDLFVYLLLLLGRNNGARLLSIEDTRELREQKGGTKQCDDSNTDLYHV